MFIQKNRPRTTVAEPIGETLAELPFTGDQAVCLGHDKAAWSGPALYRGLMFICCRQAERRFLGSLGARRQCAARKALP